MWFKFPCIVIIGLLISNLGYADEIHTWCYDANKPTSGPKTNKGYSCKDTCNGIVDPICIIKTVPLENYFCGNTQGFDQYGVYIKGDGFEEYGLMDLVFKSCFPKVSSMYFYLYPYPFLTRHTLDKSNFGTYRDDAWRTFQNVYSGTWKDFDRGHLVPNGDFSATKTMSAATFHVVNRAPQVSSFNRNVWKCAENFIRHLYLELEKNKRVTPETGFFEVISGVLPKATRGLVYKSKGPSVSGPPIPAPEIFFKIFIFHHRENTKVLFLWAENKDNPEINISSYTYILPAETGVPVTINEGKPFMMAAEIETQIIFKQIKDRFPNVIYPFDINEDKPRFLKLQYDSNYSQSLASSFTKILNQESCNAPPCNNKPGKYRVTIKHVRKHPGRSGRPDFYYISNPIEENIGGCANSCPVEYPVPSINLSANKHIQSAPVKYSSLSVFKREVNRELSNKSKEIYTQIGADGMQFDFKYQCTSGNSTSTGELFTNPLQ